MRKSITGISNAKMQDLNHVKQIERTFTIYSTFDGFQYYKDKLLFQERCIYEDLKTGILSFSEKIDISPCEKKVEIEKIYRYVMLDTPMIFHVDKCNVFMDGKKISVRPKYKMSSSIYKDIKDECLSTINKIKNLVEKENEWGILFEIHTYLIDTVLYHEGGGEHDITGPFLKNSGVCDGIAKAVKSICDYVAFPCVVIEGEAQRADGKIGRHAWNAIKIDGKWNYYDFTFDITLNQNNPCKSIKCVDYFGLDYRRMSNDHFSWSTKLDTDNQHADYFAKFKLVIACQGELENMVFRGMEEGNPDFAFRIAEHWREFAIGYSLEKLIDLAVKKYNRSYRYTYIFNEKQRTGYVHIT